MVRDDSAARRSASGSRRGPAATSGRSTATRGTTRRPGAVGNRERVSSALGRSSGRRGRRSSRPTQIRRSTPHPVRATATAAVRSRRRPGGITARSILLGVLVIALVLLLVYPVSSYLQQKSDLAALDRQIAATQASIASLKGKLEQLDDPAYVEQQARARLNYQFPDERVYVVADNGPGSAAQKKAAAAKKAEEKAGSSVLQDLADSIAEADG